MKVWIVIGSLGLAGCGAGSTPPPRAGYVPLPSAAPLPANRSAVQGATAPRLIARFGKPQLDIGEGTARKLQFAGAICVLDAYLYPQGRGEAVVTWLDTRQRDGSPIDQASCVAALSARPAR
jgi:hypothetical protein